MEEATPHIPNSFSPTNEMEKAMHFTIFLLAISIIFFIFYTIIRCYANDHLFYRRLTRRNNNTTNINANNGYF